MIAIHIQYQNIILLINKDSPLFCKNSFEIKYSVSN